MVDAIGYLLWPDAIKNWKTIVILNSNVVD